MTDKSTGSFFTRFARATSRAAGRPVTFVLAVVVLLAWAVTGPMFRFSDTWQLVINTGTTIVTFLMVFLIQNTQYRDAEAMQVKLNELIRAVEGAHNSLVDVEDLTDEELDRLRSRYASLAERARERTKQGEPDTGTDVSGEHLTPAEADVVKRD
jgi:low affinity Fe/Cu permease